MSTLKVSVDLPKKIQLGQIVDPPVVVKLDARNVDPSCNYFAMAYVIGEDDNTYQSVLGGTRTMDAEVSIGLSTPSDPSALFIYRDLFFVVPGKFNLRIDIFKNGSDGVTFHDEIHLRRISVKEDAVERHKLSSKEKDVMRTIERTGYLADVVHGGGSGRS